jgi:hypothetical protein
VRLSSSTCPSSTCRPRHPGDTARLLDGMHKVSCPAMYGESDPSWLKLLFVVFPVVTAFGGVLLTNRTNRRINRENSKEERVKSKRDAIQERGAELYTLLEAWSAGVARANTKVKSFSTDKLEPPMDAIATIRDASRLMRARFLVEVYFESLAPLMNTVGDLYIKLGNEARAAADGQSIEASAIGELDKTQKAFRQAAIKLEGSVIVAVRDCL